MMEGRTEVWEGKVGGGGMHIQLAVPQRHLSAISSVVFKMWVAGRKVGGRAGRTSRRES